MVLPASAASRRPPSRFRFCAARRSTWSSARCSIRGHEIALILAKLAGFSSTTAKAILLLKTADRGMSAQDLDNALTSYSRLQVATARRVFGFYRTRLRAPSSAIANALPA